MYAITCLNDSWWPAKPDPKKVEGQSHFEGQGHLKVMVILKVNVILKGHGHFTGKGHSLLYFTLTLNKTRNIF